LLRFLHTQKAPVSRYLPVRFEPPFGRVNIERGQCPQQVAKTLNVHAGTSAVNDSNRIFQEAQEDEVLSVYMVNCNYRGKLAEW